MINTYLYSIIDNNITKVPKRKFQNLPISVKFTFWDVVDNFEAIVVGRNTPTHWIILLLDTGCLFGITSTLLCYVLYWRFQYLQTLYKSRDKQVNSIVSVIFFVNKVLFSCLFQYAILSNISVWILFVIIHHLFI